MLSQIVELNRRYGGTICLSALGLQIALTAQFSPSTRSRFCAIPEALGLLLLVYSLVTATLSEADPNKAERSTLQRWGGLLTVLALMIVLGTSESTLKNVKAFEATASSLTDHYQIVVAAVLLLSLCGASWFVRVFTLPLPFDRDPTESDLMPMVRFCYVFTLAVIAMSVMGPALVVFFPAQEYNLLAKTPIALVKGCVHSDDSKWELACNSNDPYKTEWFISIGGAIRAGTVSSKRTQTTDNSNASAIDGWITVEQSHPTIVHGGLVVPWYFIALALMGAAVSLARKIPEYQRRALDKNDPEFTAARTREMMEFQILQLLSAPLIAVAAYNLLTPNSLQASAALGFTTGFASETILIGIRAVSDRLMGQSTTTATQAAKESRIGQRAQALV